MTLIPGYTYSQQVKIVANNETAINATITTEAASDWSLGQLVDKPDSSQVYLTFTKLVSTEV